MQLRFDMIVVITKINTVEKTRKQVGIKIYMYFVEEDEMLAFINSVVLYRCDEKDCKAEVKITYSNLEHVFETESSSDEDVLFALVFKAMHDLEYDAKAKSEAEEEPPAGQATAATAATDSVSEEEKKKLVDEIMDAVYGPPEDMDSQSYTVQPAAKKSKAE